MSDKIHLSPRQKEIYNCLVQGKTPKQISLELGVQIAGLHSSINLILLRFGFKRGEYSKLKDHAINYNN